MGKDIESWLPQLQPHRQNSNAKSLKLPFDVGMHNSSIPLTKPCIDYAPLNHALPASCDSRLPIFGPGQLKEPQSNFCILPPLIPNMALHEKLMPKMSLPGKFSSAANRNPGEFLFSTPMAPTERAPKQFIVFDQTDNKTTLMFSPGVGSQTPRFSSLSPRSAGFWSWGGCEVGIENDACHEFDDDHVTNEETEMHEDTDEIDALLYSDNESTYSDDAEEASTGHSPCSMTPNENELWFDEEDTDEVASSAGTTVKRPKLSDISTEVPTVTNAESSVIRNRSVEYEDDAESSCVGTPMGTLTGNKRLRSERIRETVSVLQTIIPNGMGKDAVVVIDEAIDYLRTLKFNAKSLGLSAM